VAYNIAANQVLASPVDAYYEGKAIRHAGRIADAQEQRAQSAFEQNSRLAAQEEELNRINIGIAKNPPKPEPLTGNDAKVWEDQARDRAARAYMAGEEAIKNGGGLAEANAAAQPFFEENQRWGVETNPYFKVDGDGLYDHTEMKLRLNNADALPGESDSDRTLKLNQYAARPDVIAAAQGRGVTPEAHATDIIDGNYKISQPDTAGRVWGTDVVTGKTEQLNQVIPGEVLRESVAKLKELEGIEFEAEGLGDLITDTDTFGPGNILQRGLQTLLQMGTAPLGGLFDTAFMEERIGRDAVERFNQRARGAFVNSTRFPVWEQEIVDRMLLKPNDFSLGSNSAKVKFLELLTYTQNRIEQEKALQEMREPVRVERPRLGTEFDPLIFPPNADPHEISNGLPVGTVFIDPISGGKVRVIP